MVHYHLICIIAVIDICMIHFVRVILVACYLDVCCVGKYHSKLLETQALNTREETGC